MKQKKSTRQKNKRPASLKAVFTAWEFIFRHRFSIFLLVLTVPLTIIVKRSDTYLNPVRDENAYNTIRDTDKKSIEKYQSVINYHTMFTDQYPTIAPQLPGNRQNPFTE